MRPIGKHSISEVRDDPKLLDAIHQITGLSAVEVAQRLGEAGGNMHVRKLFAAEWPVSAEALGDRTAKFARDFGFHAELIKLTGSTQILVSRRLNNAAGKTLLRNIFDDFWPPPGSAKPAIDVTEDPYGVDDAEGDDAELGDGTESRASNGDPSSQPAPPSQPAQPSPTRQASAPERIESEGEIESEEVSGATIETPFDPNEIRVKLWTPTVDLVLTRLRENEIDLAPDFQRATGIWKERTQSRLIESLLIRVPLPAFYMDSANEDKLLVIDGIQRLTAMKRFVTDNELVLRDLEYLHDCTGKRFSELPRPFRRRIEETMLTVHIIDKGTPDGAKLNIFKRLNTGGMPLTSQEVRHAMSPGPVRDFLKRLAASTAFTEATQGRFSDNRMTDRECVLRFCAFILTPPSEYPVGDLDKFLLEAMQRINAMTDPERAAMAARLDRAMNAAAAVLREHAFRKPQRHGRPRPPVNKALFEAWAVGFDARRDEEIQRLVERRDEVQERFESLIEESREFEQALSQGTGDPAKVKLRFGSIDKLLAEIAAC